MYEFLKRWFRSPARSPRCRRERRANSFRPGLEALEDRQLLSAAPVVNAMVNEDFFVDRNSRLWKIDHTQTNPVTNTFLETTLDNPVRASSLSVGTDKNGRGMAAYINDADGQAYEWDDTTQQVQSLYRSALGVTNNVKAVSAGQGGYVFVLTTSNHLAEFDTAHQQWTDVGGSIASVSASAARISHPAIVVTISTMADVVKTDGTAWEWNQVSLQVGPFSSSFNSLTPLANSSLGIANNVKSVSRAPTGVSFVLLTSGVLFEYDPASQAWSNLGGNIASVSAGTDAAGNAMASVVTLDGNIWDWSTTHPWDSVHGFYQQVYSDMPRIRYNPWTHQVISLPKPAVVSCVTGANGISDIVLSDGSLYQYSDASQQWTLLDTGAA